MTTKPKKLNSMRLLEQHNIPYEALQYPNTIRDAVEVAEVLGVPAHLLYKTLVIQSAKAGEKPILAMLASERHLDLKKLAVAAGEKKVQLAAHKDAEALTGLQVGGISPLALTHKGWRVFLDAPASELAHLMMSAGEKGTQIRVPTADFIRLVGARLAEIGTDSGEA
jgi:Cys-tRNA(Pro)/Cys-tRNA(Cys) deacylase